VESSEQEGENLTSNRMEEVNDQAEGRLSRWGKVGGQEDTVGREKEERRKEEE
jgi:hypothetical protein